MNHADIEAMYAPKLEIIKAMNIKNRAVLADVSEVRREEELAAFEIERNRDKAEKWPAAVVKLEISTSRLL